MKKWLFRLAILCVWGITIIYAYGMGGLAGMYKPDRVKISSGLALDLLLLISPVACDVEDTLECGNSDTAGKAPVDCSPFAQARDSRAVLFAFGQSNSANSGKELYVAGNGVVNFNPHDGKCYALADPLLGPDGEGGAVWGRVADKLIAGGRYKEVLIVPIGIGGTDIARWTPGGDLHVRVESSLQQLAGQGITPTHVLWHQGEADALAGTSAESYSSMFSELVSAIRGYGVAAPVLPAVATVCASKPSAELAEAQRALPGRLEGVFPGADTDTLQGPSYRFDDCHFAGPGLEAHAELWVEAIDRVDNAGGQLSAP